MTDIDDLLAGYARERESNRIDWSEYLCYLLEVDKDEVNHDELTHLATVLAWAVDSRTGDSEKLTTSESIQLESAKVEWRENEYATAHDIPVEILPNGWLYTPETGSYHPPNEIERVMPQANTETDSDETEVRKG